MERLWGQFKNFDLVTAEIASVLAMFSRDKKSTTGISALVLLCILSKSRWSCPRAYMVTEKSEFFATEKKVARLFAAGLKDHEKASMYLFVVQ